MASRSTSSSHQTSTPPDIFTMGSEHMHPIQNSEVYILNKPSTHTFSHPTPPSPPTPCEARSLSPVPDSPCLTPPFEGIISCPTTTPRLQSAVHVLSTEATALSHLTRLYETDPIARGGFNDAVSAITHCMSHRGKVVICGVGKSGHIAKKLVATMNSLKVSATYLHPTEALHGDLGKVGEYDVILLITFSGRTPELLSLLPHFDSALPLLIITSHVKRETCAIIDARPDAILLPAPIHESEVLSFGVSAPTTSTTIALALGDALAVTVSDELHPSVAAVFGKNHPGGAIGQTYSGPKKLMELAVAVDEIPALNVAPSDAKAVHVIMAGYQSPSGWVRFGSAGVANPRRIGRLVPGDMEKSVRDVSGLMINVKSLKSLASDLGIKEAANWVMEEREEGTSGLADDNVLAVVDEKGTCLGLVEVGAVLATIS